MSLYLAARIAALFVAGQDAPAEHARTLEAQPFSRTSVVSGLRSLSSQADSFLVEYELRHRIITWPGPTRTGREIPEIDADEEATVTRFCYARFHGRSYWEYRGDERSQPLVAWSDGELWRVSLPWGLTGSIQDKPPDYYFVSPFFILNGDETASFADQVQNADTFGCSWDDRYHTAKVLRVEAAIFGLPPRRLMLALDPAEGWMPRRIYRIQDDYLYKDYEVKEWVTLPNGLKLPSRYRLYLIGYESRGHFLVTVRHNEYEARMLRSSCDDKVLARVAACDFEPGAVILNELSGERFVAGDGLQVSSRSWARVALEATARDEERRRPWRWERNGEIPCAATLVSFESAQLRPELENRCGTLAMAQLLCALDGVEEDPWTAVTARLADSAPADGNSLRDLIDCGADCGVELVALEFPDKTVPTTGGSFIAMLEEQSKGIGEIHHHFVFVSDVSEDGVHRQVIDFPQSIRPIECGVALAHWTGVGLFRKTPTTEAWSQDKLEARHRLAWCLLIAGLAAGGTAMLWRRRSRTGEGAA